MRIGEVIGTVTLNRWHPSLAGGRYKLVVPLTLADLADQRDPNEDPNEELTAYDDLGADVGCRVAISEGREAAQPFHPDVKPIDTYIAAILDTVQVRPEELS